MATGAVLVGRRTFDLAGLWDGDHHGGVPIFVPTHQMPDDPQTGPAKVTYVTEGIESAAGMAKAAELEPTRVVDAPGVTHLHYRVHRTR